MTRFSVFRRLAEPELCCAVPQTMPLPHFLNGRAWEFGGVVEDQQFWTARGRDASWLADRNGFYIFQESPVPADRPVG